MYMQFICTSLQTQAIKFHTFMYFFVVVIEVPLIFTYMLIINVYIRGIKYICLCEYKNTKTHTFG